MPIDFATVAASYQEQFAAQTHQMKPLFERLAESVKILDRRASDAERATRAYPLLRYRDEALCVTVDARLVPQLPRNPSLGFVDGLRDGGTRFIRELGFVKTAAQQELALPQMLGPIAEMVGGILRSLERFEQPTSEMFDPNRAQFSDLFGVGNLVWSSLLGRENQDDLRGVAFSVSQALGLPTSTGGTGAAEPIDLVATIDQITTGLDQAAAAIFDVVLALPVLALGLDVVVQDGALRVKVLLLTKLTEIEREVYELRASIVERLLTGTTFGSLVQAGLDVVQGWVSINVWILSMEIPRWTMELVAGLSALLDGITAWGRWVSDLAETFRTAVESILGIDLVPVILGAILPPAVLGLLPALPSFTLDDLISTLIGAASGAIRDTLVDWLGTASDVLSIVPGGDRYAEKLADLAAIVALTLTPSPFTYDPDVMPTGPIATFPDIYDSVFGGGRKELLLSSIETFGTEVRGGIGGVLGGAGTMASSISTLAYAELDTMAQQGSGLNLAKSGGTSVAMADTVFGDERGRLRGQRRPNALGMAFDEVMAGGGIALAAAVIPIYVGGMTQFWADRTTAKEHPTSAHILARNGRLALVRVPRLLINAPGAEPEREVAETIGTRFRVVVADAYLDGRDRMSQLARPRATVTKGGRRG